MLQRGDSVPDFNANRLDGGEVRYGAVWQRRNLVLVVLPRDVDAETLEYITAVEEHAHALCSDDVELVLTSDTIPSLDPAAVLVADRWGEVHFAASGLAPGQLPAPAELAEWIEYVRSRCPECEGESR